MIKRVFFLLSSFLLMVFVVLNLIRFSYGEFTLVDSTVFFTQTKYGAVFTLHDIKESFDTFPQFDFDLIRIFGAIGVSYNNILVAISSSSAAQVVVSISVFVLKILLLPLILSAVLLIDILNTLYWFVDIIYLALTGTKFDYVPLEWSRKIIDFIYSW